MEYVQMTLDDWMQMKQKLKQELLGVKQSFVRIGYALRKIDDEKLYERDGYKSIAEFAKAEYGLEPSTTSRFISINREYSVDGYSEILRTEFADLGRSQLEEMLKLPVSDRQMIQHETSREDIRDLKRFNKDEPEEGVADDLKQLIEKFWREHLEILDTLDHRTFTEENIKQFVELVNPSGSRSYKKGLYFLMMYENRVAVKKFGQDPQNMTWWEFYQITEELIGDLQAERVEEPELVEEAKEKTAERQQETEEGKELKDEEQRNEASGRSASGSTREVGGSGKRGREEKNDCESTAEQTVTEPEKKESQGEEIAPAQISSENQEILEEDQIPGQTELTKDFPEYCPKSMLNLPEEPQEEPEREVKSAYGTRRQYLAKLSEEEIGTYLAAVLEKKIRSMKNTSFKIFVDPEFWRNLLTEEVDEEGREIECVN